MVSVSALALGSIPAVSKCMSVSLFLKLLRNVFRRCEKAWLTTLASASRSTCAQRGVCRGVNRTMADCTLGGGKNASGGTSKELLYVTLKLRHHTKASPVFIAGLGC